MSTSTWTPPLSPSLGHVILILHHLPDTKLCDSLYLEVPIDIATTICFIGVKYLAYLGFAILNHVGWISKIPRGASVNPSDPFEGIYYFVVPNQSDAGLSQMCYGWPSLTFSQSYLTLSSTSSVSNERMASLRLRRSFLMRSRSCIQPVHLRVTQQSFVKRPTLFRTHEAQM